MNRVQRFAYAQTRLQAHHARFPNEAEWQRLEAITDIEHLLDVLRNSPLRPWVISLNAQMDSHRLEQTLRTLFRDYIEAVASWQPAKWRAAVRWTKHLPDLPALEHLLERSVVPEWIRTDPVLRPFALESPSLRAQALEESEYAPMIRAGHEEPRYLVLGWNRHWRTLWPRTSAAESRPLEWLASRLGEQQEMLVSGQVRASRPARQGLLAILVPAFRRHPFQPATAFLHLAITAIHLERLRGALLELLLFGGERAA